MAQACCPACGPACGPAVLSLFPAICLQIRVYRFQKRLQLSPKNQRGKTDSCAANGSGLLSCLWSCLWSCCPVLCAGPAVLSCVLVLLSCPCSRPSACRLGFIDFRSAARIFGYVGSLHEYANIIPYYISAVRAGHLLEHFGVPNCIFFTEVLGQQLSCVI